MFDHTGALADELHRAGRVSGPGSSARSCGPPVGAVRPLALAASVVDQPAPTDVRALLDLVRSVAGVDRSVVSDDVLLAEVPLLERARRGLDAALGSALAELDRRGTTDLRFGHRTAAWFAVTVNCSRAEARRRLAVGRRCARLEAVRDALRDGEISFEHARVLADLATPRNEEVVAQAQSELVDLAGAVPFEVWRANVRALVDLADADGGFRPGRDTSTLRLTAGFGGSVEMAGTLVGPDALSVRGALEVVADQLWRQRRNEHTAGTIDRMPSRSELLADALVELCRTGVAHGTGGSGGGRTPAAEVTLVAHATDALGTLTHGTLTHGCHPLGPSTDDGDRLSEDTVRTLCCDPVLRAVVLDSLGNPVDLGRRTRLVPPALRRAIEVRDGGCVFPGCDAPATWCDQHHVHHWKDGGPTSVENLASLCRYHHGVTHRTGWQMTADPDLPQRFRWTRPDRRVLRSQRHGELRAGPPRCGSAYPAGTGPPRE